MIVKENIEFKRGLSYSERKAKITGQFVSGQILIAPNDNNLFIYEETKKEYLWGYIIGNLFLNYVGVEIASFIFNTKEGVNKVGIRKESGKIPNEEDKKLIQEALDKTINQKYLNIIKEKTGLSPFV